MSVRRVPLSIQQRQSHRYNPPMRPSFFHHLHPPTIPAPQARWGYTLGAGGMAVLLTLVVGVTGVLETFYYIPTAEQAALSVQTIAYLVPFGGLVRSLHYWSAQLLVAATGMHLLRVLFTGAYSAPRRFNHVLGMSLFATALLLNFTGYALRWDQGIQWALVVGTNLLKTIPLIGGVTYTLAAGGTELSGAALVRLYAWHIFGLALPFLGVAAWHLFRVRRDGGIAVPPPSLRQDHTRITRYELVRREVLAALLTGVVLLALAELRPTPLAAPIANLSELTQDAMAPWFFLWVQQLLKWGDPFVLGVLLPCTVLGILIAVPYVAAPVLPGELGRWFPRSGRFVQVLVGMIVAFLVILTALALIPAT